MGIRALNLRSGYAGKGELILNEFLLPTISNAVKYDRITSFYTIDSLLAISQGIQSLYLKGGKMRLIIGLHSFPPEMAEAKLRQDYFESQIERIRSEISDSISKLTDLLEKKRIATISWMIQDDLLEVKAAMMKGDGLFHPKTLILKDELGEGVVAIGSPNETGNGLGGNFEQIMVAKSWVDEEAVSVQTAFFDSLWDNVNEEVIVSDITNELYELIVNSLGDGYEISNRPKQGVMAFDDVTDAASKMLANYFVSGDIPALFMHQERAVIDALSRWPVRVLFADEVGLGKTFEIAATMLFMKQYCGVKRVLILTPKSVLQQWQDELYEHFGVDAWIFDSGKKCFYNNHDDCIVVGSKNPLVCKKPDVLLISAQYARGNKNTGSIFDRDGAVLPDLLIVDEAHSARVSKDLSGSSSKTLMYSMLESVSTRIPHLILATATPMQKDSEEYHAMLKLLGLTPKWTKRRNYLTSLRLISSSDSPDSSDAYNAAVLLKDTVEHMKPALQRLDPNEKSIVNEIIESFKSVDEIEIVHLVQNNWQALRSAFVKLHPGNLLTVRNTRKSLEQIGYRFPKRKLHEVSIDDSIEIQLFYDKVNEYLTSECFAVENVLFPDEKKSLGFVRISYQQRVASSLYSCHKSLERREEKLLDLKKRIENVGFDTNKLKEGIPFDDSLDELDADEILGTGVDYQGTVDQNCDIKKLRRAIAIETTALGSLVRESKKMLEEGKGKKVSTSLALAREKLKDGGAVLLFSRYTDTIDALVYELQRLRMEDKYEYAVYTGKESLLIHGGVKSVCDKNTIKRRLFSGELRLVFCSDAASEGLNLQAAQTLINVDVPWTPARLEQRIGRIARLGQKADEVEIYNVWYPYSVEARMYHRIQKRLDESNLAIGEFPEVVASSIKQAVLSGDEDETIGREELKEIRNSDQIQALNELWECHESRVSISRRIREQLVEICKNAFPWHMSKVDDRIIVFEPEGNKPFSLSIEEGLDESVSFMAIPHGVITDQISGVQIIKDSQERNRCFAFDDSVGSGYIAHDDIMNLFLGMDVVEKRIEENPPKTLPDPDRLTTIVSDDILKDYKPVFWECSSREG